MTTETAAATATPETRAPATPGAGPRGLELWEGGAVLSANIGPAAGEHLLGRVGEPGLYMWVGPNTDGKSHHLRLLAKLQRERLLRNDADITDGAATARLEFALARVTFRRLPTGELMEPVREGVDTLPRIEEIPAPIEALVTGLGRKGRDERARARLEALLTYAPIASSPQLLERLCGVLAGSALEADPGEERRRLYAALAAEAKERAKRLRVEPLRTAAEVLAFLRTEPRESVLEDHDALQELLNAAANAAEKAAAVQVERVAAARGRVDGALASAAARLPGRAPDAELLADLMRPAAWSVAGRAAQLRVALAEKRAGAEARRREEGRRRALGEAQGARPSVAAQELALARAKSERDRASLALDDARESLTRIESAGVERARYREEQRAQLQRLLSSLEGSFGELRDCYLRPETGDLVTVPENGDLASRLAQQVSADALALRSATGGAAATRDEDAAIDAELASARRAVDAAGSALEAAEQRLLAREAELDDARAVLDRWESTAALLASPIEGATDAEVARAEFELTEAETAEALDAGAAQVQAASADHAREEAALDWLNRVAEDLRRAAHAAWKVLGQIVSEQLALPWLRVEEGRILLAYDGSGSGARLARTEEEAVDVRDLDDGERVSSAELHEAVLRVMLSRRERLGGILIVPDRTLYPLDEDRLRRFSAWSRAARLWVFSERPRRKGDPADLALEYVEPLAEAGGEA